MISLEYNDMLADRCYPLEHDYEETGRGRGHRRLECQKCGKVKTQGCLCIIRGWEVWL